MERSPRIDTVTVVTSGMPWQKPEVIAAWWFAEGSDEFELEHTHWENRFKENLYHKMLGTEKAHIWGQRVLLKMEDEKEKGKEEEKEKMMGRKRKAGRSPKSKISIKYDLWLGFYFKYSRETTGGFFFFFLWLLNKGFTS
jgi:hypothetical protein